ncbi:MAG: rRNA maturation RNase YbeY [Psychrosphaera sp.]|nr:rRNA maturation RNase YbeY [Psychrosphaera sp.]
MTITVDIQIAVDKKNAHDLPSDQQFQGWVEAVLNVRKPGAELTIRIVDESESQQLNNDYRGKNSPTNVLSFPFESPPGVELNLIGDLIICANVVESEAKSQEKTLISHWAHMVTHGCLHLLGYDHISNDDAQEMESIEIETLHLQGFDNPYADDES